jgi:acyl-CoA synthetase (AMP-forming)/AMP-acid ligase II
MPIHTSPDTSRHPLQALFYHASEHPDDDALIIDDDIWSYRRLATDVVRLSHGLRQAGIEPGDRVVTAIDPSPVHAVFLFAAMMTGAILVPLSKEYNATQFRDFVDLLKPAFLVHDADMKEIVSHLDPAKLDPSRVFVCADDDARSWRHLLDAPSETNVVLPTEIDSTFLLLATSGTTGKPKLVAYNQRNFYHIAEASGRWGVNDESCFILMSPPAIISGNVNIIMATMAGCKVVLVRTFDADRMLDLVERHRGTTLFLAPFRCMPLVEAQKRRPRDVGSLRICGVGGDACRPGIAQAFESTFNVRLSNSYGMTECLGSMIFGSDWRTLHAVSGRARLVDSDGSEVPRGTIGELQMRGPNVSLGYWVGPGNIASHSKDGWFHSGDLMQQDQKGEYTYIGRAKDAIVVRNGKKVYPIEVENQLILHEAVADAAVVGMPGGESWQAVVAAVTLASDAGPAATAHDILEWLRTRLEDHKVPEGIVIVDTIPRNALGKIERARLAQVVLSS